MAHAGDTVRYGNLVFTVETVRRRRIVSILVEVEASRNVPAAAGSKELP